MKRTKWGLAAMLLAATSAVALAAGLYTNGMPTVGPGTANGVVAVAPNGVVTQLPPNQGNAVAGPASVEAPNPLIPVDVNRTGGGAPQTVAASPLQIAATYAEAAANTTTSTAHNAVLATLGALVTTESLSVAPGSTYTFTWTNSLLTTSSPAPFGALYSKSNTAGSPMTLTSVTVTTGVATYVWTNNGTGTWNGTAQIVLHL